jgi:hypothetical protein
MNTRFFPFLAAVGALLLAPLAQAQLQIRGGASNVLDPRCAGGSALVSDGLVTGIVVTNSGAGYYSAPLVTISAGVGGTAYASAVVSNGVVTSITIDSGGLGYSAENPPTVTIAAPAVPTGEAATTPQFAGVGVTSTGAGAISWAGISSGRYPNAVDATTDPAAPVVTAILAQSGIGYSFASGVPRYAFGDVIERPSLGWNGDPKNSTYWRAEPVKPGEVFADVYLGNIDGGSQPLVKTELVNVTNCSPASNVVTVAAVPSALVSGSTLLGQRVDIVNGLTLTLRGKPSEAISSSTAREFSAPLSYYYSPHAGRVFATQAGRVTVTWVSNVPDTTSPDDTKPTYKFKTESFAVGSAPNVPQRPMYWTEKSFNGPLVNIPAGRIVAANVVYNSFMPSHVVDEFVPVGYNPSNDPSNSAPAERRTLWYDNMAGRGTLHAYNLEGGVFVEYLGAEISSTGKREFLGADVVSTKRDAESINIEVTLGHQLSPWNSPEEADLISSLAPNATQTSGKALYGTSALANGQLVYHAERENNDPDKIQIYWLEPKDAEIYLAAAPNLSIQWPKYLRKYTQVWPASLSEFETMAVTLTGNGIATGPQFDPANLPQVAYQDDPAETEVGMDVESQRLLVDFSVSSDKTNRSLLKFMTGGTPWYVPLYIQAEDKLGSPEVEDPDGEGPLTDTPSVATLSDTNADGRADLVEVVNVGDRLVAPDGCTAGGYIASGINYYPAGYINPFTAGMAAAEAGAIIPVNAPSPTYLEIDSVTFEILANSYNGSVNYEFTLNGEPIGTLENTEPDSSMTPPLNSLTIDDPELLANWRLGQNNGFGFTRTGYGHLGWIRVIVAAGDDTAVTYLYHGADGGGDFNPEWEHSETDLNDMTAEWVSRNLEEEVTFQASDRRLMEPLAEPERFDLKVWWFKKVMPPSAKFAPFYLPAKVGRYQVEYPMFKPQIVIASGIGTGDLGSSQQAGGVYYQNDATKAGYNPNEEHALLLGKRAYALRDDLNDPATTSRPFVLLAYTDPTDRRPSMDVYEVVRETFTYPLAYDAIAGTKVQPPGPLFALPLPLGDDGKALNYEVDAVADLASAGDAPANYAGFSFKDRQGYDWTYRGAHAKTSCIARTEINRYPTNVYQIIIDHPGSGYETPPTVTIAPPTTVDGVTATAEAIVSNGEITGIQILNSGSGYTAAPEIKIAPPVSFGMKFYYNSLPGFFEPSLTLANQRPVGTVMPFIADTGSGVPVTLTYQPKWPDDLSLPIAQRKIVPVLKTAETLTLPKASAIAGQLPQIRGASSAEVIYQQSVANTGATANSVTLHDPTRQKRFLLTAGALDKLPPSVLTSDYAGKTYFQTLSPSLQQRFYYDANLGTKGGLVLKGEFVDEIAGEDYLNLNVLSAAELAELQGLCTYGDSNKSKWDAAINALSTQLETFSESTTVPGKYVVDETKDHRLIDQSTLADIRDRDTAVDSYALSATGKGTGYVTLMLENGEAFTDAGNTVSMQILKVHPSLYKGDLKVLLASNPLDEQVTLRHSGDYAGHPELYEFQWRYGFPTDGTDPTITEENIDTTASTSTWLKPNGDLGGTILVGGSPTATISNPAVLMGDTYFTMCYRLKVDGQADDAEWSRWTEPALVEGWIKRVLAKITPFNQRMSDLYNSEINTDVSMLTQAGKRWEGDIALNLNNINDVGLIEIYETVLNRGKNFTIGSGIDFPSANNGMILAAGYLNDLYTILGNEAYADGANPTISIDDASSSTEVNTSRFSFEGQVASSLDEELALLKGRDDSVNPGVGTAPAYNRLWWNYTRGINSGEVLYATNYNIKEKTGSSTANGVVDAADAYRMFPQGHGDAYGHYLTALKGYYKLLEHPYFTWQTSAEDVTVLGKSVQIDYKDERKFAASAANAASSARQIVALVHRQNYKDDPASGWSQFRDGKVNSRTGVTRYQALDEWVSRSAQGSYVNWVAANTLLPDKDTNPNHSGVQIVDRTTVPELNQLASAGNDFQGTIDSANAHLNPLGLSPGAIAFDISPTEMKAGKSHFEQIYDRALRATLNAKGAFNQAAKMSRLLRNQENQISDSTTAYVDQEDAFVSQLIDIFGSPYSGDIGVGKTFTQGYAGPDLTNFFVVDRPTDLVDTSKAVTLSLKVPTGIANFSGNSIADITLDGITPSNSVTKTVTVQPNKNLLWSSERFGSAGGQRAQVGRIQQALLDSYQAQMALLESNQKMQVLNTRFKREFQLFNEMVAVHSQILQAETGATQQMVSLRRTQAGLYSASERLDAYAANQESLFHATAEFFPKVLGLAVDGTSAARATLMLAGAISSTVASFSAVNFRAGAYQLDAKYDQLSFDLYKNIDSLNFRYEQKQQIYEFEQLYRELLSAHFEVASLATDYQRSNEALRNVLVEGQNLLTDRETFRQRAAGVINGYRTKDLTFRTFRNEALEQYRTLYDLAGRYTYLAAKSYDYETGLLGTTAGQKVISNIVASRALGDLSGDQPQATVSTLGDSGLAGTMAQLNADFSVAKGRLGINNPDPYGTLFSLRQELFRIQDDPDKTSDDDAWKQTMQQYIVSNLMADPDVARYCNNLKKPDGTAVPGIVISFGSTIEHLKNFFGLPLAAGDSAYTPGSFATKISSVGIALPGYVGMNSYGSGSAGSGTSAGSSANALSTTPYLYLIPCGNDQMLAPPLGDTNTLRSWTVHDQALPLPYNLGASAFNSTNFFDANGTLSEQPWILRKHQPFRPVSDASLFYSSIPTEFTNTRLIGRSVWNTRWKIVIPAYTLLSNEQDALNRFVASVTDIQLFLRSYSNSGN